MFERETGDARNYTMWSTNFEERPHRRGFFIGKI